MCEGLGQMGDAEARVAAGKALSSWDSSLSSVTDQQLAVLKEHCLANPSKSLVQAVAGAGLLSGDGGGASASPSPSAGGEPGFPDKDSATAEIKDVNGYTAEVTMRVSEWVQLRPSEASTLCSADGLTGLDEDARVVYARRLSVRATFPQTAQGDWSNGGAALMVAYSSAAGPKDAEDEEVVCRPDGILDDDSYGYGATHIMLFDVSPALPTSNMTVYRIVAKTPANPKAQRKDSQLPRGSVILAGHNHPDSVTDGMITGRRDDFDAFQKVGYVGDDGQGGGIPAGGTLEN